MAALIRGGGSTDAGYNGDERGAEKYLDLASEQMQLTAENMANVDTPGYKTQGFDFAGEFSRALDAEECDAAGGAGEQCGWADGAAGRQ